MKISVIIPYHKEEAYLRDCLDSLKEQNFSDMEILLICDHVNAEEVNFISDYQSNLNIKTFFINDKTGVAAARNAGLDMAAGDYVYFLDCDDYLYGNTLELLYTAALEREDDITYGKKNPTWYQRGIYITKKQEESGDEEEENENSTIDAAELDVENNVKSDKASSSGETGDTEDTAEDDSDDSSEDDPKTLRNSKGSLSYPSDTENEPEAALTEEELKQLKEARIRTAYRILITKRKGVRNISVLNILFKRSFINENKIRFPENIIYFSDIPFLLEAMSKTERYKKCLSAKYIKRNHNDAINLPSLSQIKDSNRFYEFLMTYYETVKRIPQETELRHRFDRKYINYYSKSYAPKLKRNRDDVWRNKNFDHMFKLISGMDREVIKSLRGYQRRIVKALLKKDVKKSIRMVKIHLGFIKIKKILKNKRAFAKFLYIHFFLKQPMMDNWILFESFYGKNYSDSPKYVYEYLAKNYPGNYRLVWAIDKKHTHIPFKHKKIKRYGIKYAYYLARCKYYVFNGRQPDWVIKRYGNIFLETWHGTPLKKLVFDMEEVISATPQYKEQAYKQSRAWDYLIAPNEFCSETFRRCFMFENKMLETGYPRNDILHAPGRDKIAASIRKKLGIPGNKKVILYAPTWRDDEFYGKGKYKFELHLDLEYLKAELGRDYVVLLRTHYFIADSIDVSSLKGFAVNVSRYDDISELYLISDILITDYSSVFFDYANLKRPMLFFTYDLEKYRDTLRGFYFDIEKLVPGPLLFTSEEVAAAVKDIYAIQKKYSERYENFYDKFCGWEDGHATEKVVKSVFVR